jgi:ABC-type tungstate transport system substrate-binding protein
MRTDHALREAEAQRVQRFTDRFTVHTQGAAQTPAIRSLVTGVALRLGGFLVRYPTMVVTLTIAHDTATGELRLTSELRVPAQDLPSPPPSAEEGRPC